VSSVAVVALDEALLRGGAPSRRKRCGASGLGLAERLWLNQDRSSYADYGVLFAGEGEPFALGPKRQFDVTRVIPGW
jgi:hypothetical protein